MSIVFLCSSNQQLEIGILKRSTLIIPINLKYLFIILAKYLEDFYTGNHKTFGEQNQVRSKFVGKNTCSYVGRF